MKKILLLFIKAITAIAATVLVGYLCLPLLGLQMNITDSLPIGIYHRVDTTVQRGDTVLFCLNKQPANLALQRGYLTKQWLNNGCPLNARSLMKSVAAVQGDTVVVNDSGVTVNGELIANSRPLTEDGNGRPMPTFTTNTTVPEKTVWVVSDYNPYSWDSRYYGAVPTTNILSVVRPLFTVNYRSWEMK